MACSAYTRGEQICKNGFPINSACRDSRCSLCGKPTNAVAMCMRDEIPERLVDDAGAPVLATQ
jgi:ferredoxin